MFENNDAEITRVLELMRKELDVGNKYIYYSSMRSFTNAMKRRLKKYTSNKDVVTCVTMLLIFDVNIG